MSVLSTPAFRLRVYDLMEAAQGVDPQGAREELDQIASQAEFEGHTELAQLAHTGRVLHDVVHSEDRDTVAFDVADLVHRAEALDAPALQAMALGLRAVVAGSTGESEALLADAGLAVALAEREDLPALDRCFVWVLAGAAYTTLNLWELVDELYDRAAELAPACEQPRQQAAVAVNRFLIRLDWAAALLEHGDEAQALAQLVGAEEAAETALLTPDVPDLWQRDALACRDLLTFVQHSFGVLPGGTPGRQLERLEGHRQALAEAGDVEMLPFLEAFTALGLMRLGQRAAAQDMLADGPVHSSSSGALAFQAWARAEVAMPEHPDEALQAVRDYATVVCDLRWNARNGVLAAARARIDEARLAAEHAVLSREVMRDPLTGLENRRRFDQWLGDDQHPDRPTSLILIDVDHFKQVNDVHGHAVGDEALRRVARAITDNIRDYDVAVRLGGDEFAVIMVAPDRLMERGSADQVLHRAARGRARAIAAAVANTNWDQIAPGLDVNISVGLSTGWLGEHHPGAAETLYRLCDEDLYSAKFRQTSRVRA
ncbi:GGDEF domain-containing protein [Nocardioides mangrovicus]|uniref:GGDEF domain-containing protein n=1 Tax=Nocardioides mangrovicus TaxID=2478913 RepID=A0A3L8NWM8_9ACTN|nr:GGDEF domain-containing protein [Nocardioides mangrovicus]RLV47550.1 GGDEF domain-containing protein [Nocardioides mangrovicus]